MGPQPGMGMLNPNADGTEVPWVPAADIKPSQPEAGDPSRRIILPGCDYPPADAIPVDETGDANLAIGVATVLLTVTVPDTYTFRISGIGFGADDETVLRFVTWTINGTPPNSPVLGYNRKPATFGSIPQVSYIFAIVGSSTIVTVIATNNTVGGVVYVVARLLGWFYNEVRA
jgi:hypothetical protein